MDNIFGQSEDVLKDRWQQSGSTPKNICVEDVENYSTIYNPPAGKTLYISTLAIVMTLQTDEHILLYDGNGGPLRFVGPDMTQNNILVLNFSTPLIFEDKIYARNSDGTSTYTVTLAGWEE